MLKFEAVGSEKYTLEDDGFDGFGTKVGIIKCRSNQAGQVVSLIYDKVRGVDSLRTSIAYAKERGLTGGNKNSFYFLSHKDRKFSLKNVHEDFRNDRELYKIMYDNIIPELSKRLSTLSEDDKEIIAEEFDY